MALARISVLIEEQVYPNGLFLNLCLQAGLSLAHQACLSHCPLAISIGMSFKLTEANAEVTVFLPRALCQH